MKELHTSETDFLTLREAAQQLRVSAPTVWRWVRDGKLAAYRLGGGAIRVRRGGLARVVARQSAKPGLGDLDKYSIALGDPNVAVDEIIAELDRFRRTAREVRNPHLFRA